MSVDYKIVASPKRAEMAEQLKAQLGLNDEDIIYDTRPNGGNPYVPTKKAWLQQHSSEVTHRVVLNEDVQVCEGFKTICEQMAQSHPDCAFSLFSMSLDGSDYDSFIENLQTPYVSHDFSMWGCAILMPISIVEDCFRYIDTNFDENVHESYGIQCFLRNRRIPILTTMPITVQHLGDDSLYDPALPVRRTTRFEEQPDANWTSTDTANAPEVSWFKPKAVGISPVDTFLQILKGADNGEQ